LEHEQVSGRGSKYSEKTNRQNKKSGNNDKKTAKNQKIISKKQKTKRNKTKTRILTNAFGTKIHRKENQQQTNRLFPEFYLL
jgi:hypothetical protein